jgi:hypothetical protein
LLTARAIDVLTTPFHGDILTPMNISKRVALACASGFLLVLAFVPTCFAADLPAAIVPAQRIELLNGKDFTGWTFCLRSNTEPAKTFTVTNGLVHCTGQPFGYMRTEKSYRNYRLTIEWRFVKVAPSADNTGVFVHLQPPDQVWPTCIENQGQYQHQGDYVLMSGATCKVRDAVQTRMARTLEAQNEKPPGEWNSYEIVCSGNTLKTYVNGKLMNEATECSVSSGAIGLQSEGGEYEVRKVSLEPLKSSP